MAKQIKTQERVWDEMVNDLDTPTPELPEEEKLEQEVDQFIKDIK